MFEKNLRIGRSSVGFGAELISLSRKINNTLYSLSSFFIYLCDSFVCVCEREINEESRRLQLNVPIQFVLSISHRFDIFFIYAFHLASVALSMWMRQKAVDSFACFIQFENKQL